MSSLQKDAAGKSGLSLPHLSPTGYEYYLMIPFPSGHSPEIPRYRKHLLALDPSLKLGANLTTMDSLDEHQVVAIEDLLKERNARTEIEGEWVLCGLRTAVGLEKLELIIKFRGYSDFVIPRRVDFATEAVEDRRNDEPVEASAETPTITADKAEEEISETDTQRPDSFDDDSDFESTVGRRSPTPTSDTGSGAITPVAAVIRSEKEVQIDELDALEEAACKCAESLDRPSVTALWFLNGVLQARKILMGKAHVKTWKTMENLGDFYGKWGWHEPSVTFLGEAVNGLKKLLGEEDERTLTAMYKLANAKYLAGRWWAAWSHFELVLEGRVAVLGKNRPETLDALNRLEEIFYKDYRTFSYSSQICYMETLLQYSSDVRGENHPATLQAIDCLLFFIEQKDREYSTGKAIEYLQSLLHFRIPALRAVEMDLGFFFQDGVIYLEIDAFNFT
ncbi:hypothetical protein RUND412_002888 [Rhizina undulata]